MTHEYVIALGGSVAGVAAATDAAPTAIAWAADRVLAVGSDDVVRAISRGDSTFLDLAGAAVTALPPDLPSAEAAVAIARGEVREDRQVRDERGSRPDRLHAAVIQATLERAGLSTQGDRLEPGAAADLAFWAATPRPGTDTGGRPPGLGIVAIVRAGAFIVGDVHTGPFRRLVVTPASGGDRG